MVKFKITTDNVGRKDNPEPKEVGWISRNLNQVKEVDFLGFKELISSGYTWSTGIFKDGKRKSNNWIEQQVFTLEFDSGVTHNEILKKFESVGLTPNFYYPSFSDTPEHPKFKIVLVTDIPVADEKLSKHLQLGLMDTIGNVDLTCKDSSKLFFGGNSCDIISVNPVSLQQLYDTVNATYISKDKNNIPKYPTLTEYLSGVKDFDLFHEFKYSSPYSTNVKPSFIVNNSDEIINVIDNFDFIKLEAEVNIWKAFVKGKFLNNKEIFGLATSMIWVKGGIARMKDTMIKFNAEGKTEYTDSDFSILRYVKKQKYQPQRLVCYSPYPEDADFLNPITAVKEKRGLIEITGKINKQPLIEAEKLMEAEFERVLEEASNKIYLFKLPTGIGKTRLLETVNATLAFPTNRLKEEVSKRMKINHIKTPEFPNLIDEELQEKIEYFYSVGLTEYATKLVNEISKDYRGLKFKRQDVDSVQKYLKEVRRCYATKETVLTTHARVLHSEFKSNTVIFDECPLNSILTIKTFHIKDLIKLDTPSERFELGTDITAIIEYLIKADKGMVIETPTFTVDLEILSNRIKNNKILSDIISFLHSDYFLRDAKDPNLFTYIQKNELPENKKVIIMSGTLSTNIYKAIYGERVEIIDLSDVEHKGIIRQHTAKSFSRQSLKLSIDKIDTIINTDNRTITFKNFVDEITNAEKEMYFGNVSGYDSLKGVNINVLGTPHLNPTQYVLIGSVLGLKLKPRDLTVKFRTVEWNGFRFKFNTYTNDTLSAIQLDMIEAELLQAVGRARALRENVTVDVYSNLPLRVSTAFVN
ncbi:hypothetical protein [Arthrospiribacter ruber]|uniref:Uncharacterized protein n=1 Tax=Arthrospiribacter ruber TaxID=2487934 RepID=A0A951J1I0_9BACT|nr:hypothetical protein [Arthrospiribacter ruber]MBW3469068.1 hypothetical protein [Arthrospiribacter ruber]